VNELTSLQSFSILSIYGGNDIQPPSTIAITISLGSGKASVDFVPTGPRGLLIMPFGSVWRNHGKASEGDVEAVVMTGGLDMKRRMDSDQAGVTWHARCGYGMRRGHVDGYGRGKAIGKMQVVEFMGFEVYEPGGGDTGAEKKLWVGMTRG
jgi:hypothetical protein